MSGVLYVVSGPIGNLGDITLRALETLKNSDLILSEDTRETFKVLNKYGIKVPQMSYRDQNHVYVVDTIKNRLLQGNNISLLSDSGTPLISDPGYKLVRTLKSAGFDIVSIPGPTAVISALVSSGLPPDKFVFLGFPPKTSLRRKAILKEYSSIEATLIFYESPFRIEYLLKDISDTLGDRVICLANELTKIHEKVYTDKVSHFLSISKPLYKGEYVVLVAKEGFDL